MAEGNSFRKCLDLYPKTTKLFPVSVRQMIIAGEKSGHLGDALLKVGRIYEFKVEETAKSLPVIMEPILLFIIGMGVALLALGIIMPIYKLSEVI
ncbi:MAG: type II secretion system F family protein [Patescibacteria group bacterium]